MTEPDAVLRVRAAIAQAAPTARSFEDLVAMASGMYPTSVWELAQDLAATGEHPAIGGLLQPPASSAWTPSSTQLPTPHPLDFEWRFAGNCHQELVCMVDSLAVGPVERLALFGTPALAEHLGAEAAPTHDVTLFERRREACESLGSSVRLRIVEGDVGQTIAGHAAKFDVLIADPPWYSDVMITFIKAAATALRVGGVALFCLPAFATRPGIGLERARLLAVANDSGLEAEQLLPGVVTYESPLFERAALRAAGLPNFNPLWRRGDALMLRNLGRGSSLQNSPRQAEEDQSTGWAEVACGPHRIRVHQTSTLQASGPLDSVVAGDVLSSVSVRDPRRAKANVWTTSNRVYATDRPDQLMAALRSLGARPRSDWTRSPRADKYDDAAVQILTAEEHDEDFRGV